MQKPFWNKVKQRWFVRIDGGKINLDPDKKEAQKKFLELMSGQTPTKSGALATDVIEKFLVWAKEKLSTLSHELYAYYLGRFAAHIRGVSLSDLKHAHVHRWVDATGWTGNTANSAIRCAVRPYSWARKLGTIPENPLIGVERPSATPRECDLADAQVAPGAPDVL